MTRANDTLSLFAVEEPQAASSVVVDLAIHREDDPAGWASHRLLAELLDCIGADAIAAGLIHRFAGLSGVFGASLSALARCPGMDRAKAYRLKAIHEATVRHARGEFSKRTVISSWTALLSYARLTMAGAGREQFRVFFLDKKNQLIADEVMNHGTVDHAPVYPREVVRRALELDASAIILCHNHPSGDPSPSGADVQMTKLVVDACRVFSIAVHDHIVVGREGVASLKALGLF